MLRLIVVHALVLIAASAHVHVESSLTLKDGIVHLVKTDKDIDTKKNSVLYVFIQTECQETKKDLCELLSQEFPLAALSTDSDSRFQSYRDDLVFYSVDLTNEPSRIKEIADNNESTPLILFWRAGRPKPNVKYDFGSKPTNQGIKDWVLKTLKAD